MSKKTTHTAKQLPGRAKTMSWFAGSILIAGLAVLAGFYMEQNTRVTGVEFSGNYFTAENDLLEQIGSPVGLMADSVDYADLIGSLQSLPYVERAEVNMGMRGRLSFTISEREPIALLVNESDRIYVAEGGIKLPLIPEKTRDVPLVYGFPVKPAADTLSGTAYQQTEDFLLEAKKNRFGWITISEVAWDDREGVVALSSENGVKLIFGQNDFAEKILHWETFYSEIITRKGIEAFQSIDLRFRGQIVTRES